MAVEIKYLTSATAIFLGLQSGMARPYWEVNITVSGDAATTCGTLGQAYKNNNDLISMGTIDREKPASISGLSRIIAGDVTFTVNNGSATYTPNATASIFTDADGTARDWMHSTINVWAGFENTSGTAYTIQRGSFLLTQLRIDSEKQMAHLRCEDAAKLPLAEYIGLPGVSGTAGTWHPPSGVNSKAIIEDALSAVGLTAAQMSIVTGINFPSYSVDEETVGDVIGKVAQAANGFIYTNGAGQVVHEAYTPVFGGTVIALTAKDSDRISKLKYIIDVKDLVNKVQITYGEDEDRQRGAEDTTVIKGRQQLITNDVIDQASIAGSLATRLLGQYSEYRPFLELDNIWLPSIDIGDSIEIHDTNTYQTAVVYEIYRMRDDITNLKTKLYGIFDVDAGKKWGFVSDTSATNLSIDQSGGSEWAVSWHSGFAFVAGTAVGMTLTGGDMETWSVTTSTAPDNWNYYYGTGYINRNSVEVKEGTYSAEISNNITGAVIGYYTDAITISTAGWYRATCWAKQTTAFGSQIKFEGGNNSSIVPVTAANTWQHLSTRMFMSGATTARITIACWTGIAYFDAVQLNPVAFDPEGNMNNVINTGYFISGTVGTSGTGITGIELHFEAY